VKSNKIFLFIIPIIFSVWIAACQSEDVYDGHAVTYMGDGKLLLNLSLRDRKFPNKRYLEYIGIEAYFNNKLIAGYGDHSYQITGDELQIIFEHLEAIPDEIDIWAGGGYSVIIFLDISNPDSILIKELIRFNPH
jgi:hypothetical protein